MALSKNDREFMKKVAEYYRGTISETMPEGSIRDTGARFGINRTKVRKILITTGDIKSPVTDRAMALKKQGMGIKEIASMLGMSISTISTYLPYEDLIYHSADISQHGKNERMYRAYERAQTKRQESLRHDRKGEKAMIDKEALDIAKDKFMEKKGDGANWKDDWIKDIRLSYRETAYRPHRTAWNELDEDDLRFEEQRNEISDRIQTYRDADEPIGALNSRDKKALEEISGERLPYEPKDVMRLHLMLVEPYGLLNEEIEGLRTYGRVEHDVSISRDIIVPADMPLYALHYVIQRAFGWQNAHMHEFTVPYDTIYKLTNGYASLWSVLVGILFRSPDMDEEDMLWADDYTGGSIKNWYRKKYTGPYRSLCESEWLIPCQEYMMEFDPEEFMIEIDELTKWFDNNPFALVERLPISQVLAAGRGHLVDKTEDPYEFHELMKDMTDSGVELFEAVKGYARFIISGQINLADFQVPVIPFTSQLIYDYDFGAGWHVEITGTWNCTDLVEEGRISQKELDRAQIKCRETYRPVLIAKDGLSVLDDVGGIPGYIEFLRDINPSFEDMSKEEEKTAKQKRKECLKRAKSQGWKSENKGNLMNLL